MLVLLVLSPLLLRGDIFNLSPVEELASPYLYDLVGWEARNFLDKWLNKTGRSLPWASLSDEVRLKKVQEYFSLNSDIRDFQHRLDESIIGGKAGQEEIEDLKATLSDLAERRSALREDVEETLESAISSILGDLGFSSRVGLIFPPVDLRFDSTPKLLVTSPRDRIDRLNNVLLRTSVTLDDREALEDRVFEKQNLSALVTSIGGIATYPAIIPNSSDLRRTLSTMAHEWLHHYFFFRPLGQNFNSGRNMTTLNETTADVAGRELGGLAYAKLGFDANDIEPEEEASIVDDEDPTAFDFDEEMRKTRLRVDELLAQGKIEEAEAYMEARRLVFVENGFHIRKINQAYFAFNGTYAENPASISPIADQLKELRSLLPDVGEFIGVVAGASSYPEFLERLEDLREE